MIAVKNISESTQRVRVQGVKQDVEANEVVEMTTDEANAAVSMYPRIFARATETPETPETEKKSEPKKNTKKTKADDVETPETPETVTA